MKRKQFIKQLMAAGMARNDAADCATLAQNADREYFKVLGDLLNFHRHQFKYMTLAWIKMRYTIIHGRNTPAGRFFADIDEMHTLHDPHLARAMEQAAGRKVVGIDESNGHDYTAKVYGHIGLDGFGSKVLIIDEVKLEPPEKENGVMLVQIEEVAPHE